MKDFYTNTLYIQYTCTYRNAQQDLTGLGWAIQNSYLQSVSTMS